MQEENQLKILCPFCNAVWSASMEVDFDYTMGSELTGPMLDESKVEIYCENCKRLVYTKKGS